MRVRQKSMYLAASGLGLELCAALGQPRDSLRIGQPHAALRKCNLITPSAVPTPRCIEGKVLLSSDTCTFFVVETRRGFTFLTHVWSGFSIVEGERAMGSLHTPGVHEIVVLAGPERYDRTIDVRIEGEAQDRRLAQ